jgi:DNA-binding IclR family transcriptional regulator
MSGENGEREPVQTVATAFRVIEAVRSLDGARVTEVATALDVAKSTAHRHLTTLRDLGYLVTEGDQYHVGLRFLSLGQYARERRVTGATLRPTVRALARETEESAQFLVPERDAAVYVCRETGSNAVDTPNSRIGETIPLHATAAGKAILASYAPETVDEIVARTGLEAITEHTITDRVALRAELDEVRDRGYSVNRQENVAGIYAVGVPVTRPDGQPIGALSVSGPVQRLERGASERDLADRLLEAANELELNIAYA